MAGHVLEIKDEQVRALLPLLLTRAQRRAIVPSKCGCIARWETAVHSAVGRDAVALWWAASYTLYYQETKIPSHSDLQ